MRAKFNWCWYKLTTEIILQVYHSFLIANTVTWYSMPANISMLPIIPLYSRITRDNRMQAWICELPQRSSHPQPLFPLPNPTALPLHLQTAIYCIQKKNRAGKVKPGNVKVKVTRDKHAGNKPDWMTDTASSADIHLGWRSTAGWSRRRPLVGVNRQHGPAAANCFNSLAERRAMIDHYSQKRINARIRLQVRSITVTMRSEAMYT